MVCQNVFCKFWDDFNCVHGNLLIDINGKCASYLPAEISTKEIKRRYDLKNECLFKMIDSKR